MIKIGIQRTVLSVTSLLLLSSTSMTAIASAATPATNTKPATGNTSPIDGPGSSNNPQGAFNIVVVPPSIALQATPGKTTTSSIKIRNQGLATEHIKVSLMKFNAHDQDGTPGLADFKPADDFAKWVTFDHTQFDALPNTWADTKVTISPPANAAFGYYYAVVFARDGIAPAQKRSANLMASVASLILLDVKAPGAVRKTTIAEFSTPKKVQEFLPLNFQVRMHNNGNVHVAPRGNIVIMKGKQSIGLIEVNSGQGYILPNSSRRFVANWQDGTPRYVKETKNGKIVLDKQGQDKQKVSWDKFSFSKLRFGHYTARLVMIYNNGTNDSQEQASVSFWVIPWRIIGVSLVALVILGAGVWALFGRPIRARVSKAKGRYATRR
jgi:hypothetical protein